MAVPGRLCEVKVKDLWEAKMQENVGAGAVVKRLKNVLVIVAKEGMFAVQRLLIEHSAIRR